MLLKLSLCALSSRFVLEIENQSEITILFPSDGVSQVCMHMHRNELVYIVHLSDNIQCRTIN